MGDEDMKIAIRKAKIDDVGVIVELHRKAVEEINSDFYSPKAIKEWLKDISEENVKHQFQNSSWIVAKTNNKLVGFGQYSVDGGEIYQINIDPKYVKQGVGRKLYEHMENTFENRGIEKISLNSTLNAIEFYKKLGFKVVGKTFIGSVEMIKMEKSLRASQ